MSVHQVPSPVRNRPARRWRRHRPTRVVTGAGDGMVRFWYPATGQRAGGPFTGHIGHVRAVAVVPRADGGVLLATAAGQVLRLWDPVTRRESALLHLPRSVHTVRSLPGGLLAIGYGEQVAVLRLVTGGGVTGEHTARAENPPARARRSRSG